MLVEKREKFLLKRYFSMMLFLTGDVFFHIGLTGMAHAERAVTGLPPKRFPIRKCLVNPAGGIRLQFAHQIRQCMFRRKGSQDVNMVRRAIDDERPSVVRADNAAKIRKQPFFLFRVQQRRAVFCAENDVRQQMGERV